MMRTTFGCDCCSKDIDKGEVVNVPHPSGGYCHLCVSCLNKNLSMMIIGLYPKESNEIIRIILGGKPNPETLRMKE